MTINAKMFHLGNDVVKLKRKIDEIFIENIYGSKELKELLIDIVRIINVIRMECLTICSGSSKEYAITVEADEQQIEYLKQKMEEGVISYSINCFNPD